MSSCDASQPTPLPYEMHLRRSPFVSLTLPVSRLFCSFSAYQRSICFVPFQTPFQTAVKSAQKTIQLILSGLPYQLITSCHMFWLYLLLGVGAEDPRNTVAINSLTSLEHSTNITRSRYSVPGCHTLADVMSTCYILMAALVRIYPHSSSQPSTTQNVNTSHPSFRHSNHRIAFPTLFS